MKTKKSKNKTDRRYNAMQDQVFVRRFYIYKKAIRDLCFQVLTDLLNDLKANDSKMALERLDSALCSAFMSGWEECHNYYEIPPNSELDNEVNEIILPKRKAVKTDEPKKAKKTKRAKKSSARK